jgi:hypothetical protein
MPRFKIAGVWEGRYWYDPLEGATLPTEPKLFTMTLRTFWLIPGFSGEVWDGTRFEDKERGRISGQRSDYTIRFIKQMPIARLFHEGESLTFKEYFERFEGITVDENPAHPPLLYVGEYLPYSDSLEGTWRFLPTPTCFRSDGRSMELAPGDETGRWVAERVE